MPRMSFRSSSGTGWQVGGLQSGRGKIKILPTLHAVLRVRGESDRDSQEAEIERGKSEVGGNTSWLNSVRSWSDGDVSRAAYSSVANAFATRSYG